MDPADCAPLMEATRGKLVESIHYGAFAVVDSEGKLLASAGDPACSTFLRSSAKPFQALPFMEQEGDRRFGLNGAEVAILCASHAGTDAHVAVVRSLQAKLGVSEAMLQCGTHTPMDGDTWFEMRRRGEAPLPVRHMCSGKHSGMLGLACMLSQPLETYLAPDSPVQQAILKALAEFCSLPPEQVLTGVDGCSAPNFALPLQAAALGTARLCQPDSLAPARAAACRRIVAAMIAHPEMVAGPRQFDTRLMAALPGKVVAKQGAEGYQIVGILPGAVRPGSPALGVAIKVADGDAEGRARQLVTLELLRSLGVLGPEAREALAGYTPRQIANHAGTVVGEYRPAFQV